MVNFVLIFFCIIIGFLFRKYEIVPADTHKGVNRWILYIALPAVSFKYIPKLEWTFEMLFPIVSMLIVWIGGWLFSEILCRVKGYKQRSRSTFELATGYSNTSFIGFPLVAAYFGESKLGIAMICDQTSFVILSTAGIISALRARNKSENIKANAVFKKLITFPPLIACLLAFMLTPFVNFTFVESFFDKLVATLGPLALFSIGLQIQFGGLRKQFSIISLSVLYKLFLAPLIIFLLALGIGIKGDVARVTVIEAAMPTLLTSGIIAEQYGLNTKLINLIIGVGVTLGFLTTAIWQAVLKLYL